MKVKAAITDGRGSFAIDEVELDGPGSGEVLVEIKAAGVCHTDFDSLSWGKPLVMGHEGAGIVAEVGPGVSHIQLGDRVLLNWAIPCGVCFQCQHGNLYLCEDKPSVPRERIRYRGTGIERSFQLATMAEFAVVRKEAVVKIGGDIPFSAAAIMGCSVMTGYGSAVNAARVQPASTVAVLGTGGVGLNVIQGARIAGAAKIFAVDLRRQRLELALALGATHAVPASADDRGLLQAAEEIIRLNDGRGVDFAFECTGVPELGAAPLAMVRNGGTAVQVSGIEQEITIDMTLFEWNKAYLNPLYGNCRPEIDFPILLSLFQKGDLKLEELISQVYPLDHLGDAFADMHAGKNAKGVLLMEA